MSVDAGEPQTKPKELVAVHYRGDVEGANGQYKDYKVVVDRSEGVADWDSLDTDDDFAEQKTLNDNRWDAP